MSRLTTTLAALALSTCLTGPMLAQTTGAPSSTAPQNQGMPDNGSTASQPMTSTGTNSGAMSAPSQGQTTAQDLTGQTIYTSKGHEIGKVSAMTTDPSGQQAVSVSIEKYLGMGGQTVTMPVSSLTARSAGGYSTNLTSTQIKALAKTGGGSSTAQ